MVHVFGSLIILSVYFVLVAPSYLALIGAVIQVPFCILIIKVGVILVEM